VFFFLFKEKTNFGAAPPPPNGRTDVQRGKEKEQSLKNELRRPPPPPRRRGKEKKRKENRQLIFRDDVLQSSIAPMFFNIQLRSDVTTFFSEIFLEHSSTSASATANVSQHM
jgi:hypothetical protein